MRLVLASLCATAAARINGVPSPSFSPGLNEFQVGLGASAALLCAGLAADGFAFVTQGHACLVERLGPSPCVKRALGSPPSPNFGEVLENTPAPGCAGDVTRGRGRDATFTRGRGRDAT